ncbi:MAG: class I SAM-dependent methyltransferase, partial [Microcoleaceae cyanobacterium]
MSEQDQDLKEKIRQQFDTVIYPKTPIEESPKNDYDHLFIHDINTPYYLRHQKLIDTKDKVILDAGVGS